MNNKDSGEMVMDKCRICLQSRKKMCSIFEKADKITYSAMILSIADVKISHEDEITDKLCSSCRRKLIDAYNFKLGIERSDTELHKTANLKRISFSNLNDIKVKLEIETDYTPHIPQLENISNKLLMNGADCVSYNNTVIKKIEKLSDYENKSKSLSVLEFLNSIKTECDNDCNYEDYEVQVDDYPSDSGSNYSNDKKMSQSKKKNILMKKKIRKKLEVGPKQPKPIKPVYMSDLRIVPNVPIHKKDSNEKHKRIAPTSICPFCGKMTKSIHSHMLIHTGKRTFKCDQCPKAFYKQYALNMHKLSHSQSKNFKCDQCVAAFHRQSTLNRHMIMHLDEKKHVCDICNKAFKRKAIMNRHKLTHNFGIKPVKCELCPLTFNTKYGLRHHMRVHTGERPFKCEICSQPYSYKHDFNRHCLKKHGVFLKRRSVHVMNEEVLQRERALMRELALRAHGIIKDGDIGNSFDGPQGAMAYELAMKAIEANKIPISV